VLATHLFQTDRLILNPFEPEDLLPLRECLNHPDLAGRRYTPWQFPADLPLTASQVESVLKEWSEEEKTLHLSIKKTPEQHLIGYAEANWEWDPHCTFLCLVINPAFQHQGFGSEALENLLDYLFNQTPAHNVSCWLSDWNSDGLAFALKHGFQECGRSRREGLRGSAYYDEIVVDLLRPEWQSRKGGGYHGT
jgi:RimJ/RimL family protein N-acetyltransferase